MPVAGKSPTSRGPALRERRRVHATARSARLHQRPTRHRPGPRSQRRETRASPARSRSRRRRSNDPSRSGPRRQRSSRSFRARKPRPTGSRPAPALWDSSSDVHRPTFRDNLLSQLGPLKIAADGHPATGISEGEREHARGGIARAYRRVVHRPGLTSVTGPEDTRDIGPSGSEPGVPITFDHQAGAAGGKRSLALPGRRHVLRRWFFPGHAAVIGRQDREPSVHRVAQYDPMVGIPERQRIQEAFRVGVLEAQGPGVSTVIGGIDPRFRALADREQERLRSPADWTSRKSRSAAPGTVLALQVVPPSIVRVKVPWLPLAQTTRSFTTANPRRRALVPLFWAIHWADERVGCQSVTKSRSPGILNAFRGRRNAMLRSDLGCFGPTGTPEVVVKGSRSSQCRVGSAHRTALARSGGQSPPYKDTSAAPLGC